MQKNNILQYESTVWATADLLLGAGIKQSDFPKYMMPFFALIMVESRLIRMKNEKLKDLEENNETLSDEDFNAEVQEADQGYNDFLFEKKTTLKDICKNDKTFELDFHYYLIGLDDETKDLLGVDKGSDEDKFLDISNLAGLLTKKNILFDFVKAWSEIDLVGFDNSEITTLEEHIKRKWADMSAETAGEQYTPDDVISVIADIIGSKITNEEGFITLYDPTCGGGNMLFGVEDRIKQKFNRPTATYGQDWNDALYALAKIESRFRKESHIEYGNTLTNDKYWDKEFDVIVANPPYGVDWKGYKSNIEKDKTDRFKYQPAVSDGQLLFTQHIISKMDSIGISVVVHNGSTLFSGDAGSGESNIRKWLFDQDIVEAIIQLPTDEFFNTGIFTYLWVFNKDKKPSHKNKVIMIDASAKFVPMKNNKGKKRKEIDEANRQDIIKTLTEFKNNDYAQVLPKEHFYFNKQAIQLTNPDENGKSIVNLLKSKQKSIKLEPIKIQQDDILIDCFTINKFDGDYQNLKDYNNKHIKEQLKTLDYKEQKLIVHTQKSIYFYDEDKETIIKQTGNKKQALGCGKIIIKSSYKKATNTQEASISISVELIPDYKKDYEIIPFDKNEQKNQQNITDFMAKYITKPFVYLENKIGVEINFNKLFYKPEVLRPLEEIVADIQAIDAELKTLESEFKL